MRGGGGIFKQLLATKINLFCTPRGREVGKLKFADTLGDNRGTCRNVYVNCYTACVSIFKAETKFIEGETEDLWLQIDYF